MGGLDPIPFLTEPLVEVRGATITGTEVTIYNTGAGLKYVQIAGNATVNLSAPSSGDYQNMFFFNSRSIPAGDPDNDVIINGTADSTFD